MPILAAYEKGSAPADCSACLLPASAWQDRSDDSACSSSIGLMNCHEHNPAHSNVE